MRPSFANRSTVPTKAELETRVEELERELDHQRRLAKLGTLAAAIAHEVNNILTPVSAIAQVARQDPSNALAARRALDLAITGAAQATAIADAILSLARPSETASARCNVRLAVNSALSLAGLDWPGEIAPQLEIPSDLEAAIDASVLQQIALNLIINSRRAMRARQGLIRIQGRTCSTGNSEQVQLEIHDTGCGIRGDRIERVFEPFLSFDSDGVRSAKPRSIPRTHGLGLAICRLLVEQVGGSIAVQSTSPEGTCILIRLRSVPKARQSVAA